MTLVELGCNVHHIMKLPQHRNNVPVPHKTAVNSRRYMQGYQCFLFKETLEMRSKSCFVFFKIILRRSFYFISHFEFSICPHERLRFHTLYHVDLIGVKKYIYISCDMYPFAANHSHGTFPNFL